MCIFYNIGHPEGRADITPQGQSMHLAGYNSATDNTGHSCSRCCLSNLQNHV